MIDALDAAGLLARFALLHPVAATATGIHAHDGAKNSIRAIIEQKP